MKELRELFRTDKKAFFRLLGEGLLLMVFLYLVILISYILQP
jgi:hypothetical protein